MIDNKEIQAELEELVARVEHAKRVCAITETRVEQLAASIVRAQEIEEQSKDHALIATSPDCQPKD